MMMNKTIDCHSIPKELNLMISLALREKSLNIPENMDWKKFDVYVRKNRMEPIVAEGIKQLPVLYRDGNEVLKNLTALQNKHSLLCMRQMQNLVHIMKHFECQGIRALSVKGPLLAMELYGNPSFRYSRDLDVLVSKEDFENACVQIKKLGYKEVLTVFNKTPLRREKLNKKGGQIHRTYIKEDICIELHWKLSFRFDIEFEKLWQKHREKLLLGQKTDCLGEYDNISYLICHAAGHGYHRLRWLMDIYELQKHNELSWETIYQETAEQKMGAFTMETILILYMVFGNKMLDITTDKFEFQKEGKRLVCSYDEALCADFDLGYRLAKVAFTLILQETEEAGSTGRRYAQLLPSTGKKKNSLEFIEELIEPCKADLEMIDLPDQWYFLYYFIRPFHKLWRMSPFDKRRNRK